MTFSKLKQIQSHLRGVLPVYTAVDPADDELPSQADLRPVQVPRVYDSPGHVPHDHMQMQIGLPLHLGHVARAGGDLHVAGELLGLIFKLLAVEHAQGHIVHRADPADLSQGDLLLFAYRLDRIQDLFSLLDAQNDAVSKNTVFHVEFPFLLYLPRLQVRLPKRP